MSQAQVASDGGPVIHQQVDIGKQQALLGYFDQGDEVAEVREPAVVTHSVTDAVTQPRADHVGLRRVV